MAAAVVVASRQSARNGVGCDERDARRSKPPTPKMQIRLCAALMGLWLLRVLVLWCPSRTRTRILMLRTPMTMALHPATGGMQYQTLAPLCSRLHWPGYKTMRRGLPCTSRTPRMCNESTSSVCDD
jgi:hypothetical protein